VWSPYDYSIMRGPSDYDRTHRFTASAVWALPRPGRMLHSRALGIVADDWQLSGLVSATTGGPFSITATNNSMAGAGTSRTDLVGNLFLPDGRSRGDKINQWFNSAAVVQPQPGGWGNLGRNVLRNPSGSSTDVSMTRSIPLKFRETANLQFRTEF